MIELKVQGNSNNFPKTNDTEAIQISLKGDLDKNSGEKISFNFNNHIQLFNSKSELYEFSKEIRGTGLDKLILTFIKYKFDSSFVNYLGNQKSTAVGLVKALFLIYSWIELPLSHPEGLDIEKQLYNDFIVDWTNRPEPQNDLYFISKVYINSESEKILNKLVELNLLASFQIIYSTERTIDSYFIPLIKPGVPRGNFKSDFDIDGHKTYTFWKTLLNERDFKIRSWINNRYS